MSTNVNSEKKCMPTAVFEHTSKGTERLSNQLSPKFVPYGHIVINIFTIQFVFHCGVSISLLISPKTNSAVSLSVIFGTSVTYPFSSHV